MLGDSWDRLGFVLLLQGEPAAAAQCCHKSLVLSRTAGRRKDATTAIFKLFCCATGIGDYLLGAQLTGAHDVLHAAYMNEDVAPEGAYRWNKWSHLEQKVREENQERLRQALGEAEFERAYTVGRGLSFNDAADLALAGTLSD